MNLCLDVGASESRAWGKDMGQVVYLGGVSGGQGERGNKEDNAGDHGKCRIRLVTAVGKLGLNLSGGP